MRVPPPLVAVLLGMVAALLAAPGLLLAQSRAAAWRGEVDAASWLGNWSPLAVPVDLPRALPRPPQVPGLLDIPPQVGLFWMVGNPALLAVDVLSPGGELTLGFLSEAGTYRRPLDDDGLEVRRFSGAGWRRLHERAAVLGRVLGDQELVERGSPSDAVAAHGSNPFVLTDTTVVGLRRLRALLEGGYGWEAGGWSLGLATGVDLWQTRTQASRFPRRGRVSAVGVTAGAARAIPLGARIAVTGRWLGRSETLTLTPFPAGGVAYRLEGYHEPDRREISQQPFFLRMEGGVLALGAGVVGRMGPVVWAAHGERAAGADGQFTQRRADPPTDRWEADAWTLTGAVQVRLLRGQAALTAMARYVELNGEATRADLEGAIFRARESLLHTGVDLRWLPHHGNWAAAARLELRGEARVREDFIAEIGSDVQSWTPGGTVEVMQRAGPGTTVSISYGAAPYYAVSVIPNPGAMGPVYQRLIAPELALHATASLATSFAGTLRQRVGPDVAVVTRLRRDSVSPRGETSPPPFAPEGNRILWWVSVGVQFGSSSGP